MERRYTVTASVLGILRDGTPHVYKHVLSTGITNSGLQAASLECAAHAYISVLLWGWRDIEEPVAGNPLMALSQHMTPEMRGAYEAL